MLAGTENSLCNEDVRYLRCIYRWKGGEQESQVTNNAPRNATTSKLDQVRSSSRLYITFISLYTDLPVKNKKEIG